MKHISRARWLEPIGQACAAGAFLVQFFFLDPASSDLMAGHFTHQAAVLSRIEQRVAGTFQPTPANMFNHTLDTIPLQVAQQRKAQWRPWLISLFLIGAFMTVVEKAAAIRYSTK